MMKPLRSVLMLLAFGALGFAYGQTAVPVCGGSQLTVVSDADFEGDSAMGGQRGDQFVVENVSKTSCKLRGTPGVTLLDRKGRRMGTSIVPTAGTAMTLKPAEKATFEFGYHSCEFVASASDRDPKRCKISATAQVRFRGITRVFSVREKIDAQYGVEQVFPPQIK